MNFNANSSHRQPLGRKIKRVSDVNAMGMAAPPAPQMNTMGMGPPVPQPYNVYNSPAQFASGETGQQPMYSNYPEYTAMPSPAYVVPNSPNVSMQQSQFHIMTQPLVQDMAFQYGQQLADTGKQMMKTEIEKYVPVSRLKYYFAVDTKYVLKKLRLLFFPFTHDDWSIKYEQDTPVQPRYEVNAPDLYIPTMAYVTYVLVAGLVVGMQERFSPEQIGIQASSALAWAIVELAVYTATLYVTNIRTTLGTCDLLAYSGYKYVGIIAAMLTSLAFKRTGYYVTLVYCNLALAFFLMRSLKAQVLPEGGGPASQYTDVTTKHGSKRRLYFLLFVAAVQPLLSWWLTFHLVAAPTSLTP